MSRSKPRSTKQRLADALSGANAPAELIRSAIAGRYDDYESESATPIRDLVAVCRTYGLHDVAARAVDGEFDGTAEEAAAWAATLDPETRALLEQLAEAPDARR